MNLCHSSECPDCPNNEQCIMWNALSGTSQLTQYEELYEEEEEE